jgi:hypothetical protein
MAIKYKGEVSFTDSEGREFTLRLGMNQFVAAQKDLDALDGRSYQRAMFHLALVHGADTQKDLTLDDAGEIIDDLGFVRTNELLTKTKFGHNVDEATKNEERQRSIAMNVAADALTRQIDAVRADTKDSAALKVLDKLAKSVNARRPKDEGSANPLEATASSN